MAVRLLATFPLIDVKGVEPTNMTMTAYYPHVGILCSGYFPYRESFATFVSTLDGVLCERVYARPNWSWWPSRKRMVTVDTGGNELVWEPKIFSWQSTHPDDQLVGIGLGGPAIYRHVKLLDRRIWFGNRSIIALPFGSTEQVTDSTEQFPVAFTSGEVNPGRSNDDIWVWNTQFAADGQGFFYDAISGKMASPVYHTGMNCRKLLYAPEHGVLISQHEVGREGVEATSEEPWKFLIRIWALEVQPTVLEPVEVYEGIPKSGQVVTYRTRLLGDQQDPAPDELVNWLVEGEGILLDQQTKTDKDGYAIARVQYLVGAYGPSTVIARVSC